jgi:type I restriction enzyme, S subunit
MILRGEVENRFDAIYYSSATQLEIVKKTSFPVKKLSTLCTMQRGRFSFRPRNDPRFFEGNYPFIQTGDVVRASHTFDTIQFTQSLNI